ncbi:MAG: phenylalanine--tRNA ligase subunit alpha [Thermoplasmata archaeon]|nr:phenylalanine--tRNA ligase subunit alpha [Thermoplasmata archaeon]
MELSNNERRMLKSMLSKPEKIWHLDELLTACAWDDQAHVAGAGGSLANSGFITETEQRSKLWRLASEGSAAAENGLLEQRIWDWLSVQEKDSGMKDLQDSGVVGKKEAGAGVGLIKDLGIQLIAGKFVIPNVTEAITATLEIRERFISELSNSGGIGVPENDLDANLVDYFNRRKGIIVSSEDVVRTWQLTEKGRSVSDSELVEKLVIAEITPELLQGEEWRNADFKPYDVARDAPVLTAGKSHPMQALIERIRSIFLEMGFTEIEGDYVTTAGWNMDALFIPQDHPAREMQDTFYLDNPESVPLPSEYIRQWSEVHEHGGDTGSTGWGGEFSAEISQMGMLRTHTTVNTIRHLADNPSEPCRVFGIGRVFRKESIDRTHLPEFHQIEGIIMEPNASLPMLVTTLKEFYKKMGYPEVRVRPAYFPYTEPSMEVEVKWRGQWLELGGAGIFRPEVTEPLGLKWPVCAWGMGLERLAMLVLGLDDIRQLYISDLEWLSNQPML